MLPGASAKRALLLRVTPAAARRPRYLPAPPPGGTSLTSLLQPPPSCPWHTSPYLLDKAFYGRFMEQRFSCPERCWVLQEKHPFHILCSSPSKPSVWCEGTSSHSLVLISSLAACLSHDLHSAEGCTTPSAARGRRGPAPHKLQAFLLAGSRSDGVCLSLLQCSSTSVTCCHLVLVSTAHTPPPG